MRLASYRRPDGHESFGLVVDDGVVDLRERLGYPDLATVLRDGLDRAATFAGAPADHRLTEVELRPPVPNPDRILGIGLNTRSHLEEAAEFFGAPLHEPEYPQVFLRTAESQVGHGAPLVIPSVSDTLDYEGEIAVIIGTPGRYISRSHALSHIARIACYNDGSVRAYQQHSQQAGPAKNFPASGSFGPWLVTLDEAGPLDELVLETRVNGELRQRLEIHDLFFGFAALIEYLSQPFHLRPGDVIVTGSPAGIGAVRGRFLRPGDEVEIAVPSVGSLRNRVVAEEPAAADGSDT